MKTPYNWQEEDIEWAARQNVLIANDCGTGKTLIGTELGKRHAQGPVLLICPRLTKDYWKETIEEQQGGYVGVCGQAGRGIPWKELVTWKYGDTKVWVIVHPAAVRMCVEQMAKINWDMIIVDEAHRFKNRKAKQTKALNKLRARRKIMLTATPYGKSPADMWALLRFLYPKDFTSYWRFYEKYVEYYKVPNQHFRKVKGPKNLKALAHRLKEFYRKREKKDIVDLPPITYTDLPVQLNKEQTQLYVQLAKDLYAKIKNEEIILPNALVKFLRLQQCALDPMLMLKLKTKEISKEIPAKIEWLQAWLKDHPDEPVILVSRYKKFVDKWLRDLAPKSTITGGMTLKKIKKALQEFEHTGRLVGTLDAIKLGLNLQRAATMIIFDGTWSAIDSYQLTQRIHRVGQIESCQVIHLVGKIKNQWTVDKLQRNSVQQALTEAEFLDNFIRYLQEFL